MCGELLKHTHLLDDCHQIVAVTSWIALSFTGIFAYLNFLVPRKRHYILQTLINGLRRLEYRGYDSAGKGMNMDS